MINDYLNKIFNKIFENKKTQQAVNKTALKKLNH